MQFQIRRNNDSKGIGAEILDLYLLSDITSRTITTTLAPKTTTGGATNAAICMSILLVVYSSLMIVW